MTILALVALIAASRAVLTGDSGSTVREAVRPEDVIEVAGPSRVTPLPLPAESIVAASVVVPEAAPEPPGAPLVSDPATSTREDSAAVESSPDPTDSATPALVEGQIIGRPPPDDLSEYRRVGDAAVEATPEPEGDDEPKLAELRFMSAREQPLGVPLAVRVRPTGFRAQSVSVYYQWRSEGQAGRRKRTLKASDGDFTLQLAVRELRQDRLQMWFVAEPGEVRLGSATKPIEVRIR
jgi:hypothetical protein